MAVPPLYLLQYTGVQWIKEDNPITGIIFLVGIGVVVVFFVVLNIIKNGVGATGIKRTAGSAAGTAAPPPRRFSGMALHKTASTYGLDRDQTKMLEQIFRTEGVAEPERVISNPPVLDKHFKRAYKRIERISDTDEDAQRQLATLFSLRNSLESGPGGGAGAASAPQIAANMAAVLSTGDNSYPIKVVSVKGSQIFVEYPKNALGNTVQMPRGTKVTLSFFTKSSKGFAYESQVLGDADSVRGKALQLVHTGRPKSLVQRRFRRRHMDLNCAFRPVKLEEAGSGRKKTVRMIADPRGYNGTILDISLGGCAIRTNAGINAGTRLKIEFRYAASPLVAVLGQVLRLNRSSSMNTIMHIKFIKVPGRAMNVINAIVFEYLED
ncbi:MAG: flagellar brake protein [Spirochaetaceae bacterium]|jgi:c-di-GMP-binding flagellar brake protein YcgR|nr:flagellar brake protein [Spirochaetaceae bacterium]